MRWTDCDETKTKRLGILAQQCTTACTCTAQTVVCSQLKDTKPLLIGGLRRIVQKRREVDIVHLHIRVCIALNHAIV